MTNHKKPLDQYMASKVYEAATLYDRIIAERDRAREERDRVIRAQIELRIELHHARVSILALKTVIVEELIDNLSESDISKIFEKFEGKA